MIQMKKIVRTVVGVILIVLGFVALVTPLSPGSWLILVGLELLGLRILLQDKLLAWAKAHPNSTSAKILCRFLRIRERDAEAKKKRQDACKSQQGGSRSP